jgi:hypothetical protein
VNPSTIITTPILDPANLRPVGRRNRIGLVVLGLVIVGIAGLLLLLLVIMPSLQAIGFLSLNGQDAHWSVNRSNWYKGGKTEVAFDHKGRGWSNLVKDQDLYILLHLHRVESVELPGAMHLTDRGMEPLARLTHLKSLNLGRRVQGFGTIGATLTEKGIAELTKLKELQTLCLDGHRLSPESLRLIGTMHSLVTLDLSDTTVTDADLDQLANLTQLKTLYLEMNSITPQAVARLQKKLPGLTTIDIGMIRNRSTGTPNN